MKRILLVLALGITGLCFVPFGKEAASFKKDEIKWYTFKEAQELNKQAPRKFLIDVYTDWCTWCKKMDVTTYKNNVIVKYVNENYYPIRFNAETKDTIEFNSTKYYNKNGTHQLAIYLLNKKLTYPTVVYLNEELGLIQAVPGYQDAKQLEMIVKYFAEDAYKTVPWTDYQQTFVGDVK